MLYSYSRKPTMDEHGLLVIAIFTIQQILVQALSVYDSEANAGDDSVDLPLLGQCTNFCLKTKDIFMVVQVKLLCQASAVLLLLSGSCRSEQKPVTAIRSKEDAAVVGQPAHDLYQLKSKYHLQGAACCFVMDYSTALFIAVKCIFFNFANSTRPGVLVIGLVLSLFFNSISIQCLLNRSLRPKGFLCTLHPHKLYYQPVHHQDVDCETCEECHEDDTHFYKCTLCEVHFCRMCFDKAALSSKSNNSLATTISTKSHVVHSWKFAQPWARTILFALLASVVRAVLGAHTFLLQGEVVSRVISSDPYSLVWNAAWVAVVGILQRVCNVIHHVLLSLRPD